MGRRLGLNTANNCHVMTIVRERSDEGDYLLEHTASCGLTIAMPGFACAAAKVKALCAQVCPGHGLGAHLLPTYDIPGM
eukprot:scaffold873_cov393-Prasinococcus_capsulatus_cf.AAC.6